MNDPAPVVSAIQCVGPTLVDADSVSFSVTVSKPITGLSTADFAVSGSGVSGIVTAVSGTDSSYTVTVGDISGSGSLGLSLTGAGGVLDWFGTPLNTTAMIAVDQQFTVDRQLYYDAAVGDGNWNTGDNWRVGSATGPLQAWVDGSAAFVGGLGGTIDITSPVVVSSLTFLSGAWVLEGSGVTILPSPAGSPSPLPLSGRGEC